MRHVGKLIVAVLPAFFLSGCATSRSVKEISPFAVDFSQYQNVTVQMSANSAIDEKYHPESLRGMIQKALEKSGL